MFLAGDVTQSVEGLPTMYKALGSIPSTTQNKDGGPSQYPATGSWGQKERHSWLFSTT